MPRVSTNFASSSPVSQVVLVIAASNITTGVDSEISDVTLLDQTNVPFFEDNTGTGNATQWISLQPPTPTGGYGPELTLGRSLKTAGRNVSIIRQERNATAYATDWGGPGAPQYDIMVAAIPARFQMLSVIATPDPIAVCIDLGHLDALFSNFAAQVQAKLTLLVQGLRDFFDDQNLLFVVDNLNPAVTNTFRPEVNAAIVAACAAIPRVLLNDTSAYPTGSTIQPNHFTSAAQEECGNDWATKILANT